MGSNYFLSTNDQARERLTLQHQLYVKSSVNLLHEAGIRPGMKGLEIGCGAGDMTRELARLLAGEGSLLATDYSEEQVAYVEKNTCDFENIRYKVWDVNQLSELNETFDFIYCRMVLHHLVDASAAMLQMKKCLNPGGVILCEEPSLFDSVICYPESQALRQFVHYVQNSFIRNAKDYKIAYKMEQEFKALGLNILHHGLFEPLLTTADEKMIYAMALNDISNQLIASNSADREDINALSKKLIELAKSDTSLSWIRMHQVIAKLQ